MNKRFGEAVALFGIAKLVIFFGSALSLVGAGLSFGKLAYFAVIYSAYHDDSTWYSSIATFGYMKHGQDTPFYPLYPALISIVHHLFNIPIVTAGIVISNAFLILDIYIVLRLFRLVLGHKSGTLAGVLWVLFPTTVFLSSMYTESMFIFGLAGGLLALHEKKYVRAALFGAVAALTRNTGVLLLIPFVFSLYNDYRANNRIPVKGLLLSSVIPVSLGSYFVYLWVHFGNPMIWDTMEHLWGRKFLFPIVTIWNGFHVFGGLWTHTSTYGRMYYGLQYGAVFLAILALPTIWRRLPRSWFWLSLAQVVIPLCSPGIGIQTITGYDKHIMDYFFSFDRFACTFLPVFCALAIRIREMGIKKRFMISGYAIGTGLCTSVALTLHMFIG